MIDQNLEQINLVKTKLATLNKFKELESKKFFNVEIDSSTGLNACGNFESLFRF